MKFRPTIYVRDLVLWVAISLLGVLLYTEHNSARQFELATRHGVEQALAQILGAR